MKIRTQLVLACFVLSVLPLTGIVLYSYFSSREAVEAAYRQEAERLTRNMDRRLATIRAELDERLSSLSTIQIAAGGEATGAGVVDSILAAIGEAAPLVDGLEYIPARPAIVQHVNPPAVPEAPEAPEPETPAPQIASAEPSRAPIEVFGEVEEAALTEPVVIDLPPVVMPRYEMSPLAHRMSIEIGKLSGELERDAAKMSREEREAKRDLIREKAAILEREVERSSTKFRAEMQRAQTELDARRKRQRDRRAARERRTTTTPATAKVVSAVPVTPSARPAPRPVVRPKSDLSPAERKSLAVKERKATLVLGREFNVPVEKQGEIVGQIRAQLNPAEVIRRVLGGQGGDRDEVPFAIDREGNIYTRNETERTTLNQLGITQRIKEGRSLRDIQGWIVVSSRDEESGLRVGVARPVGQNLIQLRRTAARNFGWGVGLIAFALIGIVPLANHFTRDVKRVTQGAERIAQGDLQTRLPVKGNDEFGQLALAFNRMAEDLSENQRRLLSEESARREQEMKQKLLSLEYERKSVELEDARRFQLSMLPKELPRHDAFDVAVFTQTATEVGGDYYDFHTDGNGPLSVTIGDATGHGARAGTMVTVIKALFAGYDGASPANFLSNAAEKIKRMELGRMAMALAVARFERSRVTFASAGMPPMFIHRANENRVEEVAIRATPLGTLGTSYDECSIDLHRGDTVLLMTDGFPELLNSGGQQLGYPQAMADFGEAAVASSDSNEVIAALSATVRRWHGDLPPNDDITFVVVRATA